MRKLNNMMPSEQLSNMPDGIKFEHTWIYCNGTMENTEDENIFRVYLKQLFNPRKFDILTIDAECIFSESDLRFCGILKKRFRVASLEGRRS